jgi:hypothetical protein
MSREVSNTRVLNNGICADEIPFNGNVGRRLGLDELVAMTHLEKNQNE